MKVYYRILETQYSNETSMFTPQKVMSSYDDSPENFDETIWININSPKNTPNLIGNSSCNFTTYQSAMDAINKHKETFVYEVKQIKHIIE